MSSLKNAQALRNFVEEGGLASVIADLSLESAVSGLNSYSAVADKRGLIWSVVSNLRTAASGYRRSVFSGSGMKSWFSPYSHARNFAKLQKTHCLLIVCYEYLNESDMAKKEYAELESDTGRFMPLWIEEYQDEPWGKVYLQNKFIVPALTRTIDQAVGAFKEKEKNYRPSELSSLKSQLDKLKQ